MSTYTFRAFSGPLNADLADRRTFQRKINNPFHSLKPGQLSMPHLQSTILLTQIVSYVKFWSGGLDLQYLGGYFEVTATFYFSFRRYIFLQHLIANVWQTCIFSQYYSSNLRQHGQRGWMRRQALIILQGRPRGGGGALCKAIGWNRLPRKDRFITYTHKLRVSLPKCTGCWGLI